MATCRSCAADVRWVRTTAGKLMPLDPDPRDDGNIIDTGRTAQGRGSGRVPVVEYVDPDAPTLPGLDPPVRYVSHFATCDDPERWRRRD